jgi:membrane protein YqaA with SNARE-associated domain
MDAIIEFIKHLIDPDWIMAHGGLFLVAFIIFAETGLFVGFFLPGDSLLFITGMIIASATAENAIPFASHPMNLVFWMIVFSICAVLGNMVGYWFGKKSGPLLFERRETWLFKKKHLLSAKEGRWCDHYRKVSAHCAYVCSNCCGHCRNGLQKVLPLQRHRCFGLDYQYHYFGFYFRRKCLGKRTSGIYHYWIGSGYYRAGVV